MQPSAKQFEGLLSRYFETLLQDNPTFSTMSAGLRDGEGRALPVGLYLLRLEAAGRTLTRRFVIAR